MLNRISQDETLLLGGRVIIRRPIKRIGSIHENHKNGYLSSGGHDLRGLNRVQWRTNDGADTWSIESNLINQ